VSSTSGTFPVFVIVATTPRLRPTRKTGPGAVVAGSPSSSTRSSHERRDSGERGDDRDESAADEGAAGDAVLGWDRRRRLVQQHG
jgi:hypothetical protein